MALINYYFLNESKEKMMIALFEVFKTYRKRGLGKKNNCLFLKRLLWRSAFGTIGRRK